MCVCVWVGGYGVGVSVCVWVCLHVCRCLGRYVGTCVFKQHSVKVSCRLFLCNSTPTECRHSRLLRIRMTLYT